MPRLRRLSGAETIRALEELGFEQVRQRGSHVVLKKDTLREPWDAWFRSIASWPSARCAAS
jgi:hypothetical protein